jgi:hypothetical protein
MKAGDKLWSHDCDEVVEVEVTAVFKDFCAVTVDRRYSTPYRSMDEFYETREKAENALQIQQVLDS